MERILEECKESPPEKSHPLFWIRTFLKHNPQFLLTWREEHLERCSICLEYMKPHQELINFDRCNHYLHYGCWCSMLLLQTIDVREEHNDHQSTRPKCPICRIPATYTLQTHLKEQVTYWLMVRDEQLPTQMQQLF